MEYYGYKLRVDIFVDNDLDAVHQWIKENASAYLLVEEANEVGKNRHCHAVLWSEYKMKVLRNKFVYRFKDTHSGNKSYSLGELWQDEESHVGYYRYMCKGDKLGGDVAVIGGAGVEFTKEKIEQYHREYYENAPKRPTKKRKDKSDETVEDETLRLCRERGYTVNNRLAICECLVKTYKRRQRGFTEFEAERKMNYVLGQLDDDDSWAKAMAERLCRKAS